MTLREKIKRIDELRTEIDRHSQLPLEVLNKINYKFRLEWNYHSNSMEGNSLTRRETRTVMVGNITVEGKPIRDVFEMRQHDEVITNIIRMGKGELTISEKRIKEIHAAIMYEEEPEKKKMLGEWKKEGNYLLNYRGERIDFVPPDEVAERMHKLVDWLNAEKERIQRGTNEALHPVILAAKFHLEYATIHPFYDGNGRTARILSNIILISFGYPPIYVRTDEKNIYGQYLSDIQSSGGNPDLFDDFIAGLVIRSQNIVRDAIAGKDIDDPDDLDKKIFLLEKRMEGLDLQSEMVKELNAEVFEENYEGWLKTLIERSIIQVQKFNRFFKGNKHCLSIGSVIVVRFNEEGAGVIISKITEELRLRRDQINFPELKVVFGAYYGPFKKGGLKAFGCNYHWEVKFDRIKYEIIMSEYLGYEKKRTRKMGERLLHQFYSDAEIDEMVRDFGETIYTHLIENAKSIGIDLP
jgi:Fic family protein